MCRNIRVPPPPLVGFQSGTSIDIGLPEAFHRICTLDLGQGAFGSGSNALDLELSQG